MSQSRTKQLEQSLSNARQVYVPSDPIVTNIMDQLGAAYYSEGNYTDAMERYKESLEMKSKRQHADYSSIAASLYDIAAVNMAQKHYIAALFWLKECLKTRLTFVQEDQVAISDTMHAMGQVYMYENKAELALESYLEALSTRELVLPADDLSNVGLICSLGAVYCQLNHLDNAIECYKRARDILLKHEGKECKRQVAEVFKCMGCVFKHRGDYNDALVQYKEALAVYKELYGDLSAPVNSTVAMIAHIQLLESHRQSCILKIKEYIASRSKEMRYDFLSFTKEQKIQAAKYLLDYVTTCDVGNVCQAIEHSEGFLIHKAALSNGRLAKILKSLSLVRSSSRQEDIDNPQTQVTMCM
mmetsp:Transcript_12482/g.18865  ORF Transcript_12482/g.18865 Transcript_12482/m.18865 type:complete len:357 (+) Transcript_12482:104-1174(+)